ncbi:MAG: hypothetical protein V5783_11890 [Pontiella sp.]
MKRIVYVLVGLFFVLSESAFAQGASDDVESSVSAQEEQEATRTVTAVYGVTSADYLPTSERLESKPVKPQVRKAVSRPSFMLPDVFYFVGGPIFLMILFGMIYIFLKEFEDKRMEEESDKVKECFDPE